jgi:ElaB/YqjD/DUF883 family membrane-anchored ribosome-binding protein
MTTRIKKTGEGAEHDVSDLAEEAAQRVAELKDEAIHVIEDRVEALGNAIQKHPFAAVGIGIGIGYLLARLLHRD